MSKNSTTYKRLFSLLGIFPIGVYVVHHLYDVMSSLDGADAFNQTMNSGRELPMIVPIMVLLVWIPIAFHGIYGMFVIKQSRPNNLQFNYFDNLKYLFQRISGVGLLLFIPVHVIKSKIIPAYINDSPADFAYMAENFHNPLTLTVYLLGILGACYHLANGIWQVGIGWGLAVTQKGMNRMQIFCSIFFFVTLGMAYSALWGFFR